MKTINGVPIGVTRVYQEGQYWRWLIRDIKGREYVDGENYLTEADCSQGLSEAYDRTGHQEPA